MYHYRELKVRKGSGQLQHTHSYNNCKSFSLHFSLFTFFSLSLFDWTLPTPYLPKKVTANTFVVNE